MGNFFGDALANLGKLSVEKFTGLNMDQLTAQRYNAAAQTVILEVNKSVEIVNEAVSKLSETFDSLREMDVKFYPQFNAKEMLAELNSKFDLFWKHVEYVRDGLQRGNDPQFMMEYVENRIAPAMNYALAESEKFLEKLHTPALISGAWPEIEEMMNFATTAWDQADEGARELITQMNQITTDIIELKDRLLADWDPRSENSYQDWRDEFTSRYQLLVAKHKALLTTLSQPASTSNHDSMSAIEKIKKLGELLELGLITEEEFTDKKSKLLGQI